MFLYTVMLHNLGKAAISMFLQILAIVVAIIFVFLVSLLMHAYVNSFRETTDILVRIFELENVQQVAIEMGVIALALLAIYIITKK